LSRLPGRAPPRHAGGSRSCHATCAGGGRGDRPCGVDRDTDPRCRPGTGPGQRGTLAPGDTPPDPALNPDFDPGGDSDDLPFDDVAGPASDPAPDPETSDLAPLEDALVTDVDVPVADAGDEAAEPVVASPSPTPAATPVPAPVAPAAPSTDNDVESTEPAEPDPGPRADKAHRKREPQRRGGAESKGDVEASVPVAPSPDVDAPAAETSTGVVAQVSHSPRKVSKRAGATRGDRHHVVQPGESLWSIARDVVGHDSSAARVAREVNRLWALNKTRIGTGDPDLLMVDTKLALE
jgi:hypothetical protein